MMPGSHVFTRTILSIAALIAAAALSVTAQEAKDTNKDKTIARLAGDWQISYTNGAVRHYSIDEQGFVTFEAEKRKAQISRKSEALLIAFGGESRVERLTMGTDGRLFIEHFQQQPDMLGKMPEIMGIGIRQK